MIRTFRDNPKLRDPRNFLAAAWKHLHLPPPTPVQYEIIDWMHKGPDRAIVKGFRGIGKSWICSAYACWRLGMDPNTKILVASGSAQRAGNWTTFTRQLIETWDMLAELRPEADALRDSKLSFDVAGAGVAHAPSMTSLGINGQLTGNRADLIIPDDVETESNSDTPTKREKLLAHCSEFANILSPGGRIIYLGTDQSEESLYRALEGKGYTVRVWPVAYPDRALRAALGGTLAPSIADAVDADPSLEGRSTDPARFPEEEILLRQAEQGNSRFRLQFMLDPRMSDADRYPLALSDLIVLPLNEQAAPERVVWGQRVAADVPCLGFAGDRYWTPTHVAERWAPYQGVVLALDPAGRGKDESVATVVGQLNGTLFLLEQLAWLGEGYSDAVMGSVAALAARFKVAAVVYETNFGDGMVGRLLEPHLHRTGHHCAVEEVRHSVQKEKRILDTLEPIIQQHRLVVDQGVLVRDLRPIPGLPESGQLHYRLAYQLSRITRDRGCLHHDDRIDSLSIAAAWWRDSMAQDAQRRQTQSDAALLEAEFKRFWEAGTNPLRPGSGRRQGWLEGQTGRREPRQRPAQRLGRPFPGT